MNLRHELEHIPRIGLQLMWAVDRFLRPDGWVLESKRGGYNSYFLAKDGDKRQFHFRWERTRPNTVQVYDRYYLGKRIGQIDSVPGIMRFVIATRNGRRWP